MEVFRLFKNPRILNNARTIVNGHYFDFDLKVMI